MVGCYITLRNIGNGINSVNLKEKKKMYGNVNPSEQHECKTKKRQSRKRVPVKLRITANNSMW